MIRRILFQAHWFLGITVGLVLALMGLTGATMSFQEEITGMLNPHIVNVPKDSLPLTPDVLVARIQAQVPGVLIRQLVFAASPQKAAQVRVRNEGGILYVDPYDGRVLGNAVGSGFFVFIEQLHRFLALPATEGRRDSAIGRQITGIAAFALVFFAVSGLYLRWPRRPLDWRSWLVLDLKRTGRNLYRSLHAVIGGWMALCYLISALTGLWWSYGWYHRTVNSVLGIEEMHRDPSGDGRRDRALPDVDGPSRSEGRRESRGSSGFGGFGDNHFPRHDAGAARGGHDPSQRSDASRAGREGRGDGFARANGASEVISDSGDRMPVQEATTPVRRRDIDIGTPNEPLVIGSFDAAWGNFRRLVGPDFGIATISLSRDGKSVVIERLVKGPLRGGLTDRYTFDPRNGTLITKDLYEGRPLNQTVGTNMLALHSGSIFGMPGRLVVMLCSLSLPLFAITGWLLYLGRRHKRREAGLGTLTATANVHSDLLIVHASQTGTAERIANMSAAAFASAGRVVRLLPISALDSMSLCAARCVLFVISTYGDGQAPDRARSFVKQMMARPAPGGAFSYAVLALGDREYPDYCRFGRQVDEWLSTGGAHRLFDTIEMNGRDSESEQRWWRQISELGAAATSAQEEASVQTWTLAERCLLNPGSQGGGAYYLRLEANGQHPPEWNAGDVVEVYPRNDPAAVARFVLTAGIDAETQVRAQRLDTHLSAAILPSPDSVRGLSPSELVDRLRPIPHRDYSIASVPTDGYLDLVVRQLVTSSGELGLGSGWLTTHAAKGDPIQIRIRSNAGFHRPEGDCPLILIGNGTGIAGLRAHLRERALAGSRGHWLLFGERNARYDAFFKHELESWRADGTLARLDRAYSRDRECGRYVQDLVRQSADQVLQWVADGAAVLVCGSLTGMAPAVDAELRVALGDERVNMLIANGRYRRDVY